MTLLDALDGQEYIIKQINTDDEELNASFFLWVAMWESR